MKGEHYIETKSSMVPLETTRVFAALAAGLDMPLFSTDFSRAFLCTDLEHSHLYCGYPFCRPRCGAGRLVWAVALTWPTCTGLGAVSPKATALNRVPTGPGKARC